VMRHALSTVDASLMLIFLLYGRRPLGARPLGSQRSLKERRVGPDVTAN
jgi:hypothetical protein